MISSLEFKFSNHVINAYSAPRIILVARHTAVDEDSHTPYSLRVYILD